MQIKGGSMAEVDPRWRWCNIPWTPVSNVRDLLNLYKAGDVSGKRASIDRIFGETQAMSFMWMKHKAKEQGLSWANWCLFNFVT
ncbi:hypothetical protein HanXRQr2_Chr10g0450511 [Helianthus annuus]|uniref:Uncharacterized protein n=1 Tax=Helianthus annuus TaxID=4232 RepID=A0A9K3N531_HELAN|nr:hypothetical protein HanXRQr2_Chr10g0450511 [Helianthus annuus]KAJ0884531.1 hypothetical protein HanPSC8_Chr10g0434751 [Helianthus annuus]